jgi:histone-lysine N-methyltransferase SETMAR
MTSLSKEKILFRHVIAAAHSSIVAIIKINELKLKLFTHPLYLPDLAPRDYDLFPYLKKWHTGKQFRINKELIYAVNEYFEGFEESDCKYSIAALEHPGKNVLFLMEIMLKIEGKITK